MQKCRITKYIPILIPQIISVLARRFTKPFYYKRNELKYFTAALDEKSVHVTLRIYLYFIYIKGTHRHRVKCVVARGNLINVEFYGLDDLPPKSANFRSYKRRCLERVTINKHGGHILYFNILYDTYYRHYCIIDNSMYYVLPLLLSIKSLEYIVAYYYSCIEIIRFEFQLTSGQNIFKQGLKTDYSILAHL